MGLWTPPGVEFTWQKSSIESTRPAANYGTSITPGNNTKGSYSSDILTTSDVAQDVFGVLINFNSNNSAGNARDTIVDIGVDPAGGTSYSVLIPDLLATCAASLDIGHGISYYFPIWIKSGSSIAARASINNGTVGTLRCYITLFGKPRDPKTVRVGTYCTAFGISSGTSNGTSITSGTSSEGSWTSIASSISKDYWWAQQGMGVNDSTMTSGACYFVDCSFGDASNKYVLIQDQAWVINTAGEDLSARAPIEPCERAIPNGSNLYQRIQCSTTADSSLSGAIYLVGG